jgi:uncharacterized protein
VAGQDNPGPDAERDMRAEILSVRRHLQSQFAPVPIAYSTDGRSFTFEAPLDYPAPTGSYVGIATTDGRTFLGQIISKHVEVREGPELGLDFDERPGIALEGASVAKTTLRPRIELIAGLGVLLGKSVDGRLIPTQSVDTFQSAEFSPASVNLINRYLEPASVEAASLQIGTAMHGDEATGVYLKADGFARHTFLCGQSGSGKTYSLGVILEGLLLESQLKMIIIDPNSDFVRLTETRPDAETMHTLEQVERYSAVASSMRVLRPGAEVNGNRLAVRFGDLDRREEALVLQIDPLVDREEYSSFWRIASQTGKAHVELSDILDAAMRDSALDSRNVILRVRNLGISDWSVWCRDGEPSCVDYLDDDDVRALVVDIGTLDLAEEKQVATLALLNALWKRREERQPILIVIDEAHNICPSEPSSPLQELLTQSIVKIAGEGRKFGLYLLVASQRPQKIHPNVLSQCDNLLLMRMNSTADLLYLSDVFSFVPDDLLAESSHFRQGESLIAGPLIPSPTFVQVGRRISREGGGNVPTTWARKEHAKEQSFKD